MSNKKVFAGGKDDANKEPFHKLDERVVRELMFPKTNWGEVFCNICGKIYKLSSHMDDVAFGLQAVLEVLKFGAKKYEWDSWKNVDDAQNRYMGALLRHYLKRGIDEESGFSHEWHALCNLYFLTYFELKEMEEPCNSKS